MGMAAMLFKNAAAAVTVPPPFLTNLIAWYKADVQTYSDAALTTPVSADGSSVAGWKDQSGLGHDVTQSSGTAPVLKTGIKNGLPVLRMGASTNRLSATLTWNAPQHIFMVVSQTTWSLNAMLFAIAGSGNCQVYQTPTTPSIGMYGNGAAEVDNGGLALNTFGILEVLFNGTTGQIRINAGTAVVGSAGSRNGTGLTIANASSAGTGSARCDIGEILCYQAALSTTDAKTTRDYLNARWNIF